jgi:hypothetical protein
MKPPHPAIIEELHQQVVDALLRRLIKGAKGPGVSLSAQECKTLLAALRPPQPKGRGRPPADWGKQYEIAMFCISEQWRGKSVRAAVGATHRALGVSRGSVWKARKLFSTI